MDYKSLTLEVKETSQDSMEFEGYASTFDIDLGGDMIIKGAYEKTLRERSGKVKVLWQHDMSTPIGKPMMMREDDQGLYIKAKLSDTQAGRDAMTLLRDGVIDSMSIGYSVTDSDYKDDGIRLIKELNLYEFSLVSMPMNEKAVITAVKNLDVREVERVLREAGLSRSQAKAIAAKGVYGLREADKKQDGIDEQELKALHDAIQTFNRTLTGQE